MIALPVAYYAMNKWLQNFAFRAGIGIGVFALSLVISVLIALFTVSLQTVKAATADPVNSLKYE